MNISEITIDKSAEQPIYLQIVNQITKLVQEGVLNPGEQLPTAQDFFGTYGIARGTVKHAYSLLEKNGIATVQQGKGSFINKRESSQRNADVIDSCIDQLLELNFSLDDIEQLVEKKLKEKEERENILQIGIIETCPEILDCIADSLSHFTHLHTVKLLVKDIASISGISLEVYDFLVLNSSNAQIALNMNLARSIKAEIIPISSTFSTDTLKLLAKIKLGEPIGIFCQTKRYAGIIKWELAALNALLIPAQTLFVHTASAEDLKHFCCGKRYILTSKSYKSYCSDAVLSALEAYEKNGGSIIPIEYTIDKGSYLYLEDSMRNYRVLHYKNT